MNLDVYSVIADSRHEVYEFLSEGPNGTVRKVVYYQEIDDNVYNLAFGDWDENDQAINDQIRTNNNDRNKVLATIVSTVIDFINHHPNAVVFAKGNTPSRTRLYQIGIADHLEEILHLFEMEGFYRNNWEPFEKGKNYQAFIVRRR
jgi:hypothetical protein